MLPYQLNALQQRKAIQPSLTGSEAVMDGQ